VLLAYGHLISIEAPAEVLKRVGDALPPSYRAAEGTPDRTWVVTSDTEGRWQVACGAEMVVSAASAESAVRVLLSDLELWVGECAKERIFVHAGCVVHAGRAIVLPGRSMAGKTTLTLALVAAGAEYFSDEYAVIDADGRVHPYRRPPAVRANSPYAGRALLPARSAEIAQSATDQAGPVTVGVCAHVRYRQEPGGEIRDVTAAAGILDLLDNTLAARSRTVEALASFEAISRTARFLRGFRGDADAAAHELLDALSTVPPATVPRGPEGDPQTPS
jgi:hypothetical protein